MDHDLSGRLVTSCALFPSHTELPDTSRFFLRINGSSLLSLGLKPITVSVTPCVRFCYTLLFGTANQASPGQHCPHECLSEFMAPLERTVRPNYKEIMAEDRAQNRKGTSHKKTIKHQCGLWEESKMTADVQAKADSSL